MQILILTKFMYPQNTPRAFRVDELARAFARQGHKVQVVCDVREFDFDSYTKETGVKVKTFKKDSNKPLFNRKYFLGRAFNFLMNYFIKYPEIKYIREVSKVLKKDNDYDLLITNAVPHGIHWGAAYFFARHPEIKKKIKWVAECGDPFMGNPGIKKAFYFRYIENFAFNKVDYITVPVEQAKKAYAPAVQDKIKVIPQGFDFSRIKLSQYSPNNKVTFIYAGNFHRSIRNPRKLINYMLTLSTPFKFIIYANKVSQELIRDLVDKSEGKIICRNLIPRLELIKEMSSVDFLLNLSNYNASAQVPSKLIDYTIARRPILNLKPQDFDSSKLLNFLNRDFQKSLKLDISSYSIEVVSKQFLDL